MLAIYFAAKIKDEFVLAGVGLGNTILEIIGTGAFTGLNMALATFASQAYGAKEYRQCGIYLN